MTDDRDYDAQAKLAEVEAERDHWEAVAIARQARGIVIAQKLDAAEAALPAVYRLGLDDAHRQVVISGEKHAGISASRVTDAICAAIRARPTPTAAELMARIQTGEKK